LAVRSFALVVLIACGGSPEPAQKPVTLPTSPSASASASTASPKREDGPVAQIQDAIPHWLDLLARGEDEKFLDEAIVPEQMGEVLGSRTKAELVADFKHEKHDGVVKVLTMVRTTKPDEIKHEDARTLVKWENREGARRVTFVVEGIHVWIKN